MLQFVCSLLPAGATRQKKSGIGILTLSLLIMLTGQTVKAQMVVDCSGSDPTAYPTINAALANVPGPGTTISVSGTCTEDVAINGQLNLNLGAWWGSSATLRGHLTVNNSESIYLYGLNVSNAAGDGVTVYASRAVTFDTCTSDGNAGQGLNVSQNSDVNVVGPAAFDARQDNTIPSVSPMRSHGLQRTPSTFCLPDALRISRKTYTCSFSVRSSSRFAALQSS
jgi:hypothetical protein